jgi:hypothetical protein
MGPKFSGGACVQHLAKLRSRMQEEGIPVPPPIARGLVTSKPSAIYAKAGTRKRNRNADSVDEPTTEITPLNPANDSGSSKKRKTVKKEPKIKEELEEDMPDLYDSDGEYGAAPRKTNTKTKGKKAAPKKSVIKKKSAMRRITESMEPSSDTERAVSPKSQPVGRRATSEREQSSGSGSPNVRTRGRRVDYTSMDAVPEEDEIDNEVRALMHLQRLH